MTSSKDRERAGPITLAELPTEILLMVVSSFVPSLDDNIGNGFQACLVHESYESQREKRATLSALARTCKAISTVVTPVLYRHIIAMKIEDRYSCLQQDKYFFKAIAQLSLDNPERFQATARMQLVLDSSIHSSLQCLSHARHLTHLELKFRSSCRDHLIHLPLIFGSLRTLQLLSLNFASIGSSSLAVQCLTTLGYLEHVDRLRIVNGQETMNESLRGEDGKEIQLLAINHLLIEYSHDAFIRTLFEALNTEDLLTLDFMECRLERDLLDWLSDTGADRFCYLRLDCCDLGSDFQWSALADFWLLDYLCLQQLCMDSQTCRAVLQALPVQLTNLEFGEDWDRGILEEVRMWLQNGGKPEALTGLSIRLHQYDEDEKWEEGMRQELYDAMRQAELLEKAAARVGLALLPKTTTMVEDLQAIFNAYNGSSYEYGDSND